MSEFCPSPDEFREAAAMASLENYCSRVLGPGEPTNRDLWKKIELVHAEMESFREEMIKKLDQAIMEIKAEKIQATGGDPG
jgi:hypothetical protein